MKLDKNTVAAVVTEASAKMSDPNYSAVMVGGLLARKVLTDGTGGAPGGSEVQQAPGVEVVETGISGVLKLTLSVGSYRWEFVHIEGQTFTDSGEGSCHSPSRGNRRDDADNNDDD